MKQEIEEIIERYCSEYRDPERGDSLEMFATELEHLFIGATNKDGTEKTMYCPSCKDKREYVTAEVSFSNGTLHVQATCKDCHRG